MDRAERQVNVVVSVADDHLDEIAGVVVELRRAGLRITDAMDTVGVITGTVDQDAIGALEAVRGVAEVERTRPFQAPPPDADIQ